jgi:predicted RNA-binding Zn-ribbon protein involved in translation (DUF1610 family)
MFQQPQTLIECPNCGNRFEADIKQIVDVNQDPQAKTRFLTGQLNKFPCPNCGFVVPVATPLAYHDPDKELLLIYVPTELNMSHDDQERLVGQLTRTITDSLSMEQRKGYLFNPRRALTMQGMLDTVLEGEGITRDMLNARRDKMNLVNRLVQANEEVLPALVSEHDEALDEELFQMMTAMAEVAIQNGDQAMAHLVLQRRNEVLELSSYGKDAMEAARLQEELVQRVSEDINKLGQSITHEKLLDLVISHADNDEYLQAFVGLVRPALDYTFLQLLGNRIEEAKSKNSQHKLTRLRDRIVELTEQIDQRQRAMISQTTQVLQEIADSPDLNQAIEERIPLINDLFLSVLQANIQEAEKRGDQQTLQRLREIEEAVMRKLQESSPPEIQFINALLQTEDELEMRLMITEQAQKFGPDLFRYFDALIEDLSQRGADELVERLQVVRGEVSRVMESEA